MPQIGPLAGKYQGSGYALAASLNGVLVDFVYLRQALPDFTGDSADEDDGEDGLSLAQAVVSDFRLAPAVRKLQALGLVHVGMLSAWQFVEL